MKSFLCGYPTYGSQFLSDRLQIILHFRERLG